MLMDIIPMHFDGLDCYEDALLSYLAYLQKPFQLCFQHTHKYSYRRFDQSSTIGSAIDAHSQEVLESAGQLLGTRFVFREYDNWHSLMTVIEEELRQFRPVILYLDALNCPWHSLYGRRTMAHYVMAVGMDACRLHMIDPPLSNVAQSMEKTALENCRIFQIATLSADSRHLNLGELLADSVRNLSLYQHTADIEALIRDLAEMDFQLEMSDFQEMPIHSALFRNTSFIAHGLKLHIQYWQYLSEQTGTDTGAIQQVLRVLSDKWYIVNAIFTKAFYSRWNEEKKQKISGLLQDILCIEERLRTCAEHFQSSYSCGCYLSREELNAFQGPAVPIDLKPFFNNKGFHVSPYFHADLTGTGDALFLEFPPDKDERWPAHHIPADLSSCSSEQLDNITCQGQIIPVKGRGEKLLLVGLSEFGVYPDKISVVADGREWECVFCFSDWTFDPDAAERLIWEGKIYSDVNGELAYKGYNGRLFEKILCLPGCGEIQSVKLPVNPLIHIFAMSLCN